MERDPKEKIIPAVAAVIIKGNGPAARIFMQIRRVLNPKYDWVYDGVWELPSGGIEPEESVLDALVREVLEECGTPIDPLWIVGANPAKHSWRPGESVAMQEPISVLQSLGDPHPWLDIVFLVRVPPEWEPDYTKSDGEAQDGRWWSPEELLREMNVTPISFMGHHILALRKVCRSLLENTL